MLPPGPRTQFQAVPADEAQHRLRVAPAARSIAGRLLMCSAESIAINDAAGPICTTNSVYTV
eukprot:241527-Rhodomonas_salina.1